MVRVLGGCGFSNLKLSNDNHSYNQIPADKVTNYLLNWVWL